MGIGFHVKSPFDGIEHYVYGDTDWRVRVKPIGSGSVRYSNRHATAFFGHHAKQGLIDANDYVDHPGDIAIFALLHLAIKGDSLTEQFTLNSAEVSALIGAKK